MADFQTVKSYLQELNLSIVSEEPTECILVVDDDERGVKNLVIDCEEPILIFEQVIMEVPSQPWGPVSSLTRNESHPGPWGFRAH